MTIIKNNIKMREREREKERMIVRFSWIFIIGIDNRFFGSDRWWNRCGENFNYRFL